MSVLAASNSHLIFRDLLHHSTTRDLLFLPGGGSDTAWKSTGFGSIDRRGRGFYWSSRRDLLLLVCRRNRGEEEEDGRGVKASSFWNMSSPDVMEMEPIVDCDQLDLVLEEARERSQPILIDWMANWCRKCIYLKPKLDKLAAEYVTKMKFYCVDVNNVPQALVKRGNISKMPTIQVWQDGEMKAEVIGGHKAWLVMDEVREMIQKFL